MTNTDTRPVAIYVRISREDADDPSASPEDQLKACREFLEHSGLKAADRIFSDRDISAYKKKKRPDFEALMAGIDAGEYGGVCVWKLDRMSRKLSDYYPIWTRISNAGAQLFSVVDNIDTSDPIGVAVLGLFVGIAEKSSKDTSDRIKLHEKTLANDGKPHGGGNRSFGYQYDKDTKTLTVVKAEAKIIKQVAAKMTKGESLRSVAAWLNGEGVTTTTGRTWTHQTVRQMISSPKLIGERLYNGERIPSQHIPAILTETQQTAALQAAENGRGYREAPERKQNQYLLSGQPQLLFCSKCGGPMYPIHGSSTKQVTRYQCRPEGQRCGRSIIIRIADSVVWNTALEYSQQIGNARNEQDDSIEALEAAVRAKDAILKNIEDITAEKWRVSDVEIRATYDKTIDGMKSDLAEIRQRISALEVKAAKRVSHMRGLLGPERLTEMSDRRDWLRVYVGKVWVDAAGKRSESHKRLRIEWNYGAYEPVEDADWG